MQIVSGPRLPLLLFMALMVIGPQTLCISAPITYEIKPMIGIVYIQPSSMCIDNYTRIYGDRVYFYVYYDISKILNDVKNDFRRIHKAGYDFVAIAIPITFDGMIMKNLKVLVKLARDTGLKILWLALPKRFEDRYLDDPQIRKQVVEFVRELISLDDTLGVAIWYGWTYRFNVSEIVTFFMSIPPDIRKYVWIWLDHPFAERLVTKISKHGIAIISRIRFVVECYSIDLATKISRLPCPKIVITGSNARNTNEKIAIARAIAIAALNGSTLGIAFWIYNDVCDGFNQGYALATPDGVLNPFH